MEIKTQLCENLAEYILLNNITLPLSLSSRQLLQKWRPSLVLPREIPYWNPDIKGLCRLKGMVQDQEDPELSLGYYISSVLVNQNHSINTTYYGFYTENEGELIENIFIQRYPVVLVPVPGEQSQEIFPRVILYEEMGEHIIVTSILDMIGIANCGEFHTVKFVDKLVFEEIPLCRDEVLRGLEICMGDSLAAEVMLYVLLSKVHERSSLIGAFSVNFTNVNVNADKIIKSISKLIRTVTLPLSLEFLNTAGLTPTKNHGTEKLSSSPIQIPDHSLLIIDETKLSQGTLTAKGIENVNILIQLLQSQQLTYDFEYIKINYPTNIKIIALSQGASILKLPINMNICESKEEYEFRPENKMYVEACSELVVNLTPEITNAAQEHFVNQRKDNKITVEELHLLLTLTRYNAQSYGQTTAQMRHWESALDIFNKLSERKLRV
jgi:Mini-chromosome maintenance replisome factor